MIGSIVSAVGGIVGGIIGGVNANKYAKRQEALMNNIRSRYQGQYDENAGRVNGEYNKNQLDRSENRQALTEAAREMKEQNAMDVRRAAITGATPAAQAQMRAANSSGYSNLVSSIAARGSAQRDALRNELYGVQGAYNQGIGMVDNAQNASYQNRIDQYGNMMSNSINAGVSGMGGIIDKIGLKK
jgi:hypothetical protein